MRQTSTGDGARHSTYGTGSLVLRQHGASVVKNYPSAKQTVGAHSGKHDSKNACPKDTRGGTEENVDSRPAVILKRALTEVEC